MARITPRPTPTASQTWQALWRHCPCCGDPMWVAYHNYRTITTLPAVVRLTLQIRRCLPLTCPPFRRPYRPEAEGRLALPKHELGLDVVTLAGTLRDAPHRSSPDMHQE
jgi:hypothetical protein